MDSDLREHLLLQSLVIHGDDGLDPTTSIAPRIYQTSTFRAETAKEFLEMSTRVRHPRFYTRYGNPTLERAETIIAALEKAETALVTASGMGAITTSIFALVSQGDHVIAQRSLYMGTTKILTEILPRFGVAVTFVDQVDTAAFEAAIEPNTKLMIVETPTNPILQLTDLEAIGKVGRSRGICTLADNTFASPINQHPLEYGIDLVVHSATKYLGGHHDISAGVVAGSKALIERIWNASLVFGSVLGPFDAWLLLRGLRTLPLRVRQHNQTALKVAQFLQSHPQIETVYYPGLESHPQHEIAKRQMKGFGGVLSFQIKGGYAEAERFMSKLKLAVQAASLGGFETLAVHPAAMWAGTLPEEQVQAAGIEPNLVRLSVGLEEEQDLITDIERALRST